MLRDQENRRNPVFVGVDETFFGSATDDWVSAQYAERVLFLCKLRTSINTSFFRFCVFATTNEVRDEIIKLCEVSNFETMSFLSGEVQIGKHDNLMTIYRNMNMVLTPNFANKFSLAYLYPIYPRKSFIRALQHFSNFENPYSDEEFKKFVATLDETKIVL